MRALPPTELLQAWILAGGLSTRFGSDKASFTVGGETLLGRTARVISEAGLAVTVVARGERPGGLATLVEPDGPRHPLHGVATGLAVAAALGHSHALFVPCDLPTLEAKNVRFLLAAHHAAGRPAHASAVRLLCVLPVHAEPLARRLAAEGGSVRRLLDSVDSVVVPVGELENLNRPA